MESLESFIHATRFCLANYLAHRKGVFILMYHRITDALPESDLIVSPKKFRRQMEYLKNFCQVISMAELVKMCANKDRFSASRKPQVVITLDDGYRDNYLNALPVLKDMNLSATIFLATAWIGSDRAMPRYEHLPAPDMLRWEEVGAMRKAGITICSHTHNHPHLPLLSYEQQKTEIVTAMNVLYDRFQDPIIKEVFAYTYGEYNQETLKILKGLGFKIALTVEEGINTPGQNPLELKRLCGDARFPMKEFMRQLTPDVDKAVRWRWENLCAEKV